MIQTASRALLAAATLLAAAAAGQAQGLPAAATNAILAATPTAGNPRILRLGYYAAGDAPPVVYTPLASNCAANGLINDGGGCINNTTDGNSWKGQLGPVISFEQFGAKGDGTNDDSAAINAAIAYQCGNPGYMIQPAPAARSYAVANQIVDRCGARTFAGLSRMQHLFDTGLSTTPDAPTVFKWTGGNRTAPFYMADIGAVGAVDGQPASGQPLTNAMWADVLFNCNGATGCGGALVHSVEGGYFALTAWEPRPAIYTAAASGAGSARLNLSSTTGLAQGMSVEQQELHLTGPQGACPGGASCAGQAVLQLTSAAGLQPGEILESYAAGGNTTILGINAGANQVTLSENLQAGLAAATGVAFSRIPPGIQVQQVDSATALTLTGKLKVAFSGGEAIGFGGEGIRFDVTRNLLGVNDNFQNHIASLAVKNTGAGTQGPGIVLGGTNAPGHGSGPSLAHYGNFDQNTVDFVDCSYVFNGYPCLAFGYTDHNSFGNINAGNPVILTGTSCSDDTCRRAGINGGTFGMQVRTMCGAPTVQGTALGFFAQAVPVNLVIDQLVSQCLPKVPDVDPSYHQVIWRYDDEMYWRSADNNGGTVFPSGSLPLGNAPAGTLGGNCVLMGFGAGAVMTPWNTGRVTATFTGTLSNTAPGLAEVAIYWGTGTAPVNGAPCAGHGTAVAGSDQNVNFWQAAGSALQGFVTTGQINNPGTVAARVWFDLGVKIDSGGGTAQPRQVQFTYQEN